MNTVRHGSCDPHRAETAAAVTPVESCLSLAVLSMSVHRPGARRLGVEGHLPQQRRTTGTEYQAKEAYLKYGSKAT